MHGNSVPIPPHDLTRDQVFALLQHPGRPQQLTGAYLCFLMIPIIERFGQWRFAGSATTLWEALIQVGELATALSAQDPLPSALAMLESLVADEDITFPLDADGVTRQGWSLANLEDRYPALGPYRLVVFGEGQAPYDHIGFCIVSVPTLAGHPYLSRSREAQRPQAWDGGDWEQDLDDGDDSADWDQDRHDDSGLS